MDKIEKVSVNGQVYELAGSGGGSVTPVSITYSELAALKNSNSLVAGARYRITDYVTSFKSWESAGHSFDIVVTALTADTLLAEATAMPHEGDEYFANNDLTAWKLLYDINNDTAKYGQAKEDAKGFIYGMTDEYGNKACYDFKNALRRVMPDDCNVVTEGEGLTFYTFSKMDSGRNVTDFSLSKECHHNEADIPYTYSVPSICYKSIIGTFNMKYNKIYSVCFICYQIGECSFNQIEAETYTSRVINSFTNNIVKRRTKINESSAIYDCIFSGSKDIEINVSITGSLISGNMFSEFAPHIGTFILQPGLYGLSSSSSSDEIKSVLGDGKAVVTLESIIDVVKNGGNLILPVEQDGASMMCYPFFVGYKDTEEELTFQFASYGKTFQITYNKSSQIFSYS